MEGGNSPCITFLGAANFTHMLKFFLWVREMTSIKNQQREEIMKKNCTQGSRILNTPLL